MNSSDLGRVPAKENGNARLPDVLRFIAKFVRRSSTREAYRSQAHEYCRSGIPIALTASQTQITILAKRIGGAVGELQMSTKFSSMTLAAPEHALLGRYFQQRHVLAHRQGLVDQAYVDKSGDNSYRVGQRVIVKEEGVRETVTLVERLAQGLASET